MTMAIQDVIEACAGLDAQQIEDAIMESSIAQDVADPQGVAEYLESLGAPADELPGEEPEEDPGNEGTGMIEAVE